MNNPSTCPHFSVCSGCEIPDAFDPPIWKEILSFYRNHNIEPSASSNKFLPLGLRQSQGLISLGFDQTRMKAKLAVGLGHQIGLYKKNSHDIVPIPHCLVHHASINQAVAIIKEEMVRQRISDIRYLQFFVERETGKVQVTVVANKPLEDFCKSLTKYDLWHSIWLNVHPAATNRILGDHWILIYGEPFLWQKLGKISVPFHPGAFSQAHLSLFEKMLERIDTWVKPNEQVLELFAGVGVIGLNLHEKAKHVTLIENNPYAYLSYQQIAKPNITYQCIDAKEAHFSGYEVTIVDPPRKGLDLEILKKISSPRLIYVSCGFDSFKRDCLALLSAGWQIKEGEGYLLFPGTNHVETLSLFEKT